MHQRFGRFFEEEYMRLLKGAAMMRLAGQEVPSTLTIFKEMHEVSGANSWGHVFYAGVLANHDLLQHLQSGVLPDLG